MCYDLIILHENATKTMFSDIVIDGKLPSLRRKSENKGGGETVFKGLKSCFTFGCPFKFFGFLHKVGEV